MRPNRGRGSSGPWGRLKPVDQDALDSIGLPSKGDTRLLDFKAQERYYKKIVERYMTFCSDAGERDELLRRFASLELQTPSPTPASTPTPTPTPTPRRIPTTPTSSAPPTPNMPDTKGLSDVMMALRKLREGIVASKRADEFAVQAYLFNIRLSILVKHPESYHPAILHLLRFVHPLQPLSGLELHEVLAYLVLDTACRRSDLAEAYALRRRHRLKDGKVDAILGALAHDNYVVFRKVKRSVDGHKARLIEFAEPAMRTHALKCFGRTYLSVERAFLERCTDAEWKVLTAQEGVGWELDGDKVVIRKVKGR
ncbi:hypothetical protein VD0002_g8523 [Verticillium dahliae]|uniref:CSN8/PSMD8/EIF3K domain-containing protein n=3 Tax=Verticillium dahliae TaxID=27337 RepID=G2WZL0_VERDV|nr:uncharacterized protein VDAG_03452 [Verticillium dahliae VdLs.17]KAH6703853.1 hypothetical protein EV126DRAFT_399366 [Verticillium dahliae]EGY22012.1 hypothetical protein VDAG_03452 [Verticillium dahliae VdLs.17]PNH45356.1 hypothetical protein VD0003_g9229 [Verticillium dahliae]PNH59007.1 hypothetical protein VD0002_g8523 [Verticillium dahliae]RXG42368.1 hypothetical protein VDGE_03452 [Verticillium dahliae]